MLFPKIFGSTPQIICPVPHFMFFNRMKIKLDSLRKIHGSQANDTVFSFFVRNVNSSVNCKSRYFSQLMVNMRPKRTNAIGTKCSILRHLLI